jgi:hypothetical protein
MKEQATGLGKIFGGIGFFAGLVVGFNISQNGLIALIVGVIFSIIGVKVGNLVTKILIVVIYIALVFGSAYVRQTIIKAITDTPSSQQSQNYKMTNDYYVNTLKHPPKSDKTKTKSNSDCRLFNDKLEHSNVYIRSDCDIYDCDKDDTRIVNVLPDNTPVRIIDGESIPSKVRPYSWTKVEIVSTKQIVWVADSKITCGS